MKRSACLIGLMLAFTAGSAQAKVRPLVYRLCVDHSSLIRMCVERIGSRCLVIYLYRGASFGGYLDCKEVQVKLPRVISPLYPEKYLKNYAGAVAA